MGGSRMTTSLLVTILLAALTFAQSRKLDQSRTKRQSDGSEGGGVGGERVDTNHSQILIIGAGASGVAAASRLLENGAKDVTILEAENRLGGRVHTVNFGETVVDLGAQWIFGQEGNVVYELASAHGLAVNDLPSLTESMRFLQSNGEIPDQELCHYLWNISADIRDDQEGLRNYNGSFGQFFLDRFAEATLNPENTTTADPALIFSYLNWVAKVWEFADAADSWFNVSAKGITDFVAGGGKQDVNWKTGGMSNIINLLTKRYPHPGQELPVRRKTHFHTEVKTIHWGPKGVVGPTGKKAVVVETSDGANYTADIVVVTVSLGVLKENAEILFDPPLHSRKADVIKYTGFGVVDKIFMHFAEIWWPQNLTGFSFLVTEEDRNRFIRLYPSYKDKGEWVHALSGWYMEAKQPRSVVMDWLVGEPARNMENYSDYQVMVGCMRWLEMFADRRLPWPISLTRSKWYSNRHFRGSYSYHGLDTIAHDVHTSHLAEPLFGSDGTPEVLFGGEATSEHHFGTVQGAIESGWREADRILDLLKIPNRSRKVPKKV